MRQTWTFHSAGKIVFGPGAVEQLGNECARRRLRRVLVVTDRHLEAAGIVSAVQRPLEAAGIAVSVFAGGEPEPSFAAACAACAAAKAFQPDAVLGLGGGSNMDLAKAAAALLVHGGRLQDLVGEDRIPGPILPLVCVPTTAGTGSEVTAASVLTDQANQIKVGILSNYLRPALALVDPQLTITCPPKVTADSGIDALTHAIEAYTAVDNEAFPLPPGESSVYQGRHPLGCCLAEKAISLIGRHLLRAVREPTNLEARSGMALGALLAGLAFSNIGVALVHALEYPVGGATHCSHGAGNGLLLPHVMRFNLPVRRAELAHVAALLGEDVSGLDEAAAAERAIEAVQRLQTAIGIPTRLRELGVQPEALRGFAEKAVAIRRILRVNPRPVTVDEAESILRAAW
ncbi:MAG: iron-containing alcohol dehydrogenase [Pirellulales bacterium]|nr:iron-containing alcohol dehydrogenase [Pirellulales bacterium]